MKYIPTEKTLREIGKVLIVTLLVSIINENWNLIWDIKIFRDTLLALPLFFIIDLMTDFIDYIIRGLKRSKKETSSRI